ncbi:MAG TPA: DUF393 domain-containing protein [Chlamydiales bacterium]|nr:DUF393 domain-containing protein [Chlamydiales bacterium]
MTTIVFFDGGCGLCQRSILFFLKRDTKKQFLFAPLDGQTAKKELQEWLKSHFAVDSIVVKNGDEIYYYSKAVFFLLRRLGGIWSIPGLLSFLPSWLLFPCDIGYRLVAKYRHNFCYLPGENKYSDRFLP